MRCKVCGEEFIPHHPLQKYCSSYCKNKAKRVLDMKEEWPARIFDCAQCGQRVVTEPGTGDRRTRFCSEECQRKFYRQKARPTKQSAAAAAAGNNETILKSTAYITAVADVRCAAEDAKEKLKAMGKKFKYKHLLRLLIATDAYLLPLSLGKGCMRMNEKEDFVFVKRETRPAEV